MESDKAPGPHWTRKIFIGLNFTSILTLVFLIIAAMTGAYIWGVITGRKMEAPVVAAAGEESQPVPVQEERTDRILQAHELEFTQALRDVNRKPVQQEPPVETEVKTSPEQSPQSASETVVERNDESMYDFVFQVAALRDAQAADVLRQSLEGEGLRTRLEQSGKLYLVLVLLRGTGSRAAELGDIARQLRLGEPMLRAKKPVAQPASTGSGNTPKSKDN